MAFLIRLKTIRTPIENAGRRKPVSQITDRAKRYRAQNPDVRPVGPKLCGYCGSNRNVLIDHINGRESDGSAENLMWACKSCNAKKAVLMKRRGMGERIRQFNPPKRRRGGTSEMAAYGAAIKVMRGEFDGDVAKAVATIRATPPSVRSAYTSRTWSTRRQIYGRSGRQSEIPF